MKSIDDRTMQQRLYDILKMNIKLARTNNELNTITSDTFTSFEEATRSIDEYEQKDYEEEISKLFNTTVTLEEEKVRLEKLVELVTKRIEERKSLLREYEDVTSRSIEGLSSILEELELDNYKQRLASIREYLENNRNISAIEMELENLNKELNASQEQKIKDEEKNYELEDSLLTKLRNILLGNEEYADIADVIDVDFELEKLASEIEESKKTLDTFEKAFRNLTRSGISSEKEVEYSTYVADARDTYYQVKEKEILLKLYRLVTESENEYSKLFGKREEIDKLLSDRMELRKSLNIVKTDILVDFYHIIDEQKSQIRLEKINIDRIHKLIDKITFKENKLDSYKEANQKSDILAILQEYGIIETYVEEPKDEVVETTIEETKEEEKTPQVSFGDLGTMEIEESNTEEPIKYIPNAIKKVEGVPEGINVSFVKNKANTVMRRVGKALGIEVPKVEIVKEVKKAEPTVTSVQPEIEEIPSVVEAPKTVLPQVEEIMPSNNINSNISVEEIKPEDITSKEEPITPTVELPKMESTFEAPVVELAKEEVFKSTPVTNTVEPRMEVSKPQMETPKVVPFPTPTVTEKKVEPKKEENNNSGLFWPEAKPNFASSLNNNLGNNDFFPQTPVTNEREFNPQTLNSSEDLGMPDLPQGNINLGPGPGQMANPAIKIRRAA